jgi:ribosome-associated toxin RatA of RatAB toxin-antitoxin module
MARRVRSGAIARGWVPIIIVLVLAPGTAPAGAGELDASGETRCESRGGELATGQLVVVEEEPSGGRGVALTLCGVVDAAPARVWPVVRDCGSYDQFMPQVQRSELERRDGNVAFCDTVIDLPFPFGDLRSHTRVVETARPDGGFERHWTLRQGTYRHNNGSWTLRPWQGDALRTLVVYRVDMEPDTLLPDFLLRRLQSEMVRQVFAAVRDRVGRCTGSEPPADCAGGPHPAPD